MKKSERDLRIVGFQNNFYKIGTYVAGAELVYILVTDVLIPAFTPSE